MNMNIKIDNIISKSKNKRLVYVKLATSSYGKNNIVNEIFHKKDWKRIKENMEYSDEDRILSGTAEQIMTMNSEEYDYYMNLLRLPLISTEDLVKELNRRIIPNGIMLGVNLLLEKNEEDEDSELLDEGYDI